MKTSALSILVAASEAAPLAKAGGLGDVIGNLPGALKDLGCRVTVVLPAYRRALEQIQDYRLTARNLPVQMGSRHLGVDILVGNITPGVPLCLIRQDELFSRSEIYQSRRGKFPDDVERFVLFSRSIPVFCAASGFYPDVILANDWHTGLIMALLAEGALPRTVGVFAIHNMGYLGLVPSTFKENIGLPERYYRTEGMEYHGQISLLKAGIVYSQAVTTVSPTYAREIQTPEFGSGLDGLMRSVNDRLYGILNGVNYHIWNPATDKDIVANYSADSLSGKAACKKELLKLMGLPDEIAEKPLVGMVTRLVGQKGCDLVAEAARDLFDLDLGLVLLGTGDESYQSLFSELRARHPNRFGLKLGFDGVMAHKVLAGCDMFLAPSLYEPCGLAPMFSLCYGTIPIVRATGGLRDTVRDPSDGRGPGTGFKFSRFLAEDLMQAVRRAVNTFQDRDGWKAMMLEAMAQRFLWHDSAMKYLDVFERAVAARGGIRLDR
jgi:starch synthase